jgi:bifunctional non-homologous end joining protein LigD
VAARDAGGLTHLPRSAVPARKSKTRPAPAPKALEKYAQKRDFGRTPEPAVSGGGGDGHEFVVQMHAARRLHFDLRLELDGVLKSWAVTRGPSLTLGEKRLAVRTEDHPVDYLDFEGNIPKGEYGGGSMIVWDRGRWMPQADPHKGLQKGHLAFLLDGTRLRGLWHLVRIRPRKGEKTEPWLLMKAEDEFARQPGDREITEEETTSYLSGRTNAELAAAGDIRADHAARGRIAKARQRLLPDPGKIPNARKKLLPAFQEPSLAAPCEKPPSGPKWIHEIKHNGYRMQARIDGASVRLLTRKGLDWTERFAAIATAVKKMGLASALMDGEVVVEDASGITSFNYLQADLKAGRQDRFRYFVFDLLYFEGYDVTKAALVDRKDLLQQILSGLPAGSPIRFSEHLEVDGPTMLEHSCRMGLEGIVSKHKDQPYRSGRGDHWLKSKCIDRQEFVILGYVPSTADSRAVGALALGYHEAGRLTYAGRVGTGWSFDQARSLRQELEAIVAEKPALANRLPPGAEKGVRWVAPRLVGEIEFRDWTQDRMLRGASFKGLREDKPAEEIVLETAPKTASAAPGRALAKARLTHPERILWPEPGITKQGLAEFYADIADWILPHVTGRPLSLLRCPSGTGAKCFFAKHPWQGLDDSVGRIDVGEKEPMMVIDDLSGLLNMVQAGVVEIHPWGSRVAHLEEPDRLIFDLDPGEGVPWSATIAAAKEVRDRLTDLGLASFLKTSGGKGLHVVVPLAPRAGWEEAKAFTERVANEMAKEHPDKYIATLSKRARSGRIFIDYLRNGRGSTAVAAYSTRSHPQATVSTPIDWDEVSEGLKADHFTVDNIGHRLKFLKRDPWDGFFKLRQSVPAPAKRKR